MNPNVFYTPPAPQGFTASYNPNNNTVSLNWLPSPGPVTGYILGKLDWQTWQSTNIELSANAVSYPDSIAGETAMYNGPILYVDYSIQAQYGTNGVSASASASIENSSGPQATILTGPQGRLSLVIPNVPSDLSYVRMFRQKMSPWVDFAAIAGWYGEEDPIRGLLSPLNDGYFQIPVSSITNGICQLPDSQVPPYFDYVLWVQTVRSNGIASGWEQLSALNPYGSDANTPFVDARQQLKDNLRFLLRAASDNSPFAFSVSPEYDVPFYAWPYDNYVYSGFYGEGGAYFGGSFNELHPIHANCFYRNFVFDQNNLNGAGLLNTGCYGGNSYNAGGFYLPCLTITNFPTYYFNLAGYLTNNVEIPSSQLTANQTPWLLQNDGGVVSLNGESVPTENFYGLPYISMQCAYVNTDYQQVLATYYPGDDLPSGVNGVKYLKTAQPIFTNVGYYFARPNSDPIPEQGEIATTGVTPLIVQGVGSSQQIAGYAQLGIQNGYPGVYAYLGQYFDQAYKIDANGNATTTTTGVLSPYGNFFATEPGPVALVTMPDVDTGERGTCTVYCVSLQVDRNHDGTMDLSFGGPDVTSQASPMEFWVNNSHTVPGTGGNLDKDLSVPPNHPEYANYSAGKITCPRDLENFFRLWVCGLPQLPTSQSYTITFSMSPSSGNPAVNLYPAYESDGSTKYLTDTNVAAAQLSAVYVMGTLVTDYGSKLATISASQSYTLPMDGYGNPVFTHFLFEGASTNGSGELVLTISQNGNVITQTGVWLDLHDVKDFFEHPRASDVSLNDPPTTNSGAFHMDSYATVSDAAEDKQIVIYVHGLNNKQFDYESSAQTIFKRLYWQGCHGRYVAFRWPSPTWSTWPTSTNEVSYFNYNKGEYISWQSGPALKNYIDGLHVRFPDYAVNIITVSEGGITANAAVRLGAQVDNLVLSKVTVPAEAFDGNNSSLIYSYLAAGAANTPDADVLGGYNNCFTNQCRRVNFYNDDDFACYMGAYHLVSWEQTQLFFRPDHTISNPGWSYSFDGTNCYREILDEDGEVLLIRTLTDDFEKKSYVARSRTKAIGAAGLKYPPYALTGGVISTNISLQDASLGFVGGAKFGDSRSEHGGEFNKTIQNAMPFYRVLMDRGFRLRPKL